jgi:hypothetical protein
MRSPPAFQFETMQAGSSMWQGGIDAAAHKCPELTSAFQ